ncbi:hypothetical protein B0H13DRAFT_1653984, partial [Mycena leptocephala]
PERYPFPVIVAVHGQVFGLGVDIVSACDYQGVLLSHFLICELNTPGSRHSPRTLAYLPKIVGNHSLLRELAFSAADVQRMGFLSGVVPGRPCGGAVVQEALALARVIAGKSSVTVSGTKRILLHSRRSRCSLGFGPAPPSSRPTRGRIPRTPDAAARAMLHTGYGRRADVTALLSAGRLCAQPGRW